MADDRSDGETPRSVAGGEAAPGGAQAADREAKIAAAKARAAAAAAARAGAAPAAPAAAAPRGITSSLNPGGQPPMAVQHPTIVARGSVNQGVELAVDAAEDANIRRLLGGIGAYQNPLRENRWQIDYRYLAEALRRLAEAGYAVEGTDFMGRPLAQWAPATRGWTRVEP